MTIYLCVYLATLTMYLSCWKIPKEESDFFYFFFPNGEKWTFFSYPLRRTLFLPQKSPKLNEIASFYQKKITIETACRDFNQGNSFLITRNPWDGTLKEYFWLQVTLLLLLNALIIKLFVHFTPLKKLFVQLVMYKACEPIIYFLAFFSFFCNFVQFWHS